MQQKSNIQLIRELVERKNIFLKKLKEFTETYNIEDNIFTYDNNGELYEVCEGYFEPIINTTDLKEVIDNYQIGMGIRIFKENYQLGKLSKSITSMDNINNILQITTSTC